MVKPAVPDVVSPTITAEGPNTLFHQGIGDVQEVPRFECRESRKFVLKGDNTLTLLANSCLAGLICVEQALDKFITQVRRESLDKFPCVLSLLIDRQTHAQRELGVVFKQGVRPCGTAPFAVDRVRRSGQVAAVNRRAAGGVADQRAIAEQLRHQLDVGGFAAACAGA